MANAVRLVPRYAPLTPASHDAGPVAVDGLVVTIDLDEDGRRMHRAVLPYADYAGLQAEYEGNTGTTVLNSAIDTYLGALGDTDDENLDTQYAAFLTHTAAWTP